MKKFWAQFPKLKMSDRSHLIPLERNDRAIHDPEWLGALIFRSSYEKKASRERLPLCRANWSTDKRGSLDQPPFQGERLFR